MVRQVFSIYDIKAEVYHAPFYANNMNDAMRAFHRMLTTLDIFKGYEEDYRLYMIGDWDEVTGAITQCEPVFLIEAMALLGMKGKSNEAKVD